MARVRSRRLVIDASLMMAAGSLVRSDPRSTRCREFLKAVRAICHRVILQWDRHQTQFSRDWRVSMVSLRKIDDCETRPDAELQQRIAGAAAQESVARIMLKDLPLVEAALSADRIIISLDDAARDHLGNASQAVSELRDIVWVNPGAGTETAPQWLRRGARADRNRTLGWRRS